MHSIKGFFSATLIGVWVTNVYALGLYIPFESAADMGDGRAGNAAVVRDASTNYFNPAGLVRFQHPQWVFSNVGVLSHLNYNGLMSNPGQGAPTFEVGTASTNPTGMVPAIHYVHPLFKDAAFGLSLVVPSGLGFDYSKKSLLRYEVDDTNQSSGSLSTSLAYRLNSHFSVGLGADALFTYARSIVMARTQLFTPGDSMVKNVASGIDFGWHGGVLYELSPNTRVGLAYHSQIIIHLFGTSRFFSNTPLVPSTVSKNFRATVPLASLTNLSAYHELTPYWAILGSVEYMNWRIFKYDHAYNLASPVGPVDVAILRKLRDTWYFALGSSYKFSEEYLVRGGIDYGRGSTTTTYREISIPDNNEIDLNAGMHWQFKPSMGIDVGSSYGFLRTVTINNTNPITGNHLTGRVTGTGVTLGAQLTWDVV